LLRRAGAIAEAEFSGDRTACYTGLNLLIAHTDGLFVLRQSSREPEYYTLFRRPLMESESTTGGYLVASERTDESHDWEPVTAGILTLFPSRSDVMVWEMQVAVS